MCCFLTPPMTIPKHHLKRDADNHIHTLTEVPARS